MKIWYWFIIVFFIVSCKTYKESPDFTLISVEDRIKDKKWLLKSFDVNGVDSTFQYKLLGFYIKIENKGFFTNKEYVYKQTYTFDSQLIDASGSVKFKNNGDIIVFENTFYPFYNPSGVSAYSYFFIQSIDYKMPEWEIMKLTNDEFWIKTTVNNNTATLKLQSN